MIWIEDLQCPLDDKDILITTRIGVNYAGIDAELPYRFLLKDRIFRTSKKN